MSIARRARHWRALADGRVCCELCPRRCRLAEGQRGLCFVRACRDGALVLTEAARPLGCHPDPIEKKPLYHFLPGSLTYSFGTAGCNLACRYCQNWEMSRARVAATGGGAPTDPARIVAAARTSGCRSLAFTYNDPVVFHEYALDCAAAAHAAGLYTVAVSAGYVQPAPRAEFYAAIDAANIDLKAFDDRFYRRLCGARLAPVLETLESLVHETAVWVEITTLVIPGENDDPRRLHALSAWIAGHLGCEVPLHLSAFHPAHRMRDHAATPIATLMRAREIARANGLRHVYLGNLGAEIGGETRCVSCGARLIARVGYRVVARALDETGRCLVCGARCHGVFTTTARDTALDHPARGPT
ncbi:MULTISPECIES: AmmeMemoRadiSam system radical SAM enzyme [Marichromatium]|uniref:Pyruvate formate lyase activating enzyme n=1 Tax=Marichromatium gracile TaxID=1048 RepID=A0A4R4AAK4_MARGR|nr:MULTISPECIES: AmmeMemoRadiSam system radical SAM enzyme [Marichromatium]MBK1709173.1 AmmeMemoRadiSam system radical SAM enzyme [Marichromatium gracile]RNE90431.1 AmmeMemoRadiSam system radical SAM enzyme [Marichromatium sp. AB31]TCW35987.1 pyruvate formate lyase activating enzyme [Marichromatium gracile]